MKKRDHSEIFGKSIGVLGISFVFLLISNGIIQLILFFPNVIDETDSITKIIYISIYSITLLASLLIWQKQFAVADILGTSLLTSAIVFMMNTIRFFIFNNSEIIQLIVYPMITFVIVYTFLKVATKESEISKRVVKYLTIFVIGIYPISFFIFKYLSMLHDMIKN